MASDASTIVFFLLLMLAIGAIAAYVAHRRYVERREALSALANQLGLEYVERPGPALRTSRAYLAMSQGRSPKWLHMLRGAWRGRDVRCFDFSFVVKQGKSEKRYTHGVVAVEVPGAWPRVAIVPESIGHKIVDALGAEDVDTESIEFSDRFWVRSDDRRFAYDLLHPRAMEYLLASSIERWEIKDGLLVAWQTRPFAPGETRAALDAAVGFVEHVPEWLAKSREAAA